MKVLAFMIASLVGVATVSAENKTAIKSVGSEFNHGKKWCEMTEAEKADSMKRLHALNDACTARALSEGGYLNIKEYNRVFNPTFDQRMSDAYTNWRKANPQHGKYVHHAWTGQW
jgi:hypothetical protein